MGSLIICSNSQWFEKSTHLCHKPHSENLYVDDTCQLQDLTPLEPTLSLSGSSGATWCSCHFIVRSEVHKLGIVACGGRITHEFQDSLVYTTSSKSHGYTVRPCPPACPTPQPCFLSLSFFKRERKYCTWMLFGQEEKTN